jgi:thioredoxin reductase
MSVLVVGGGPAGLSAAEVLATRGVPVTVLDREPAMGGVARHCVRPGYGSSRLLTGPLYARQLVARAAAAGAELRTATTVTGWAGPTAVEVTARDGREVIVADTVLLATGCRERPRTARLVPGDRGGGVYTTGALQQFVYQYGDGLGPVGELAVVVGAERVSYAAVRTLAHAGVRTLAMVTEYERPQIGALRSATARRVPVFSSTTVTRIEGRGRVHAIELTSSRTGQTRRVECDTVVFTGDWVPEYELPRLGGLAMDPASRAPVTDLAARTSRPGVFAAGNLLHAAESAAVAARCGVHAAAAVLRYLSGEAWPDTDPVPLVGADPVRWVSPATLRPGQADVPHGRLLLRVNRFASSAVLEVRQADQVLYRHRAWRLMPNTPVHLPTPWLRRVDPAAGPVTVALASA